MAELLRAHLDFANPNSLPDEFRQLGLGGMIRALPTSLRRKVPAAAAEQLGTLQQVGLANDGKAAAIFRAYARAGGVTGELTLVAFGATPATTQIAVAPNGDIVVLAADAITDLDVQYLPAKYDLVTMTLPVIPGTGVCALPASVTASPLGLAFLISANALVGTATGVKNVLVPAAGAPAAGKVRQDVAGANIQFAVADAVSSALLTLAVNCAIDVDGVLEAASKSI